MRFIFSLQKAIQVFAYVLGKLGPMDKVKLMKLLYLADREHFLKHHMPITGDEQSAMPYGPVPSRCLNLLRGEVPECVELFRYVHTSNNTVELVKSPETRLSEEEMDSLDRVLKDYGQMEEWELVRRLHDEPEYKQTYVRGSSRPIPYELIAELHAGSDPDWWWRGRIVIQPESRERMAPPLLANDADL